MKEFAALFERLDNSNATSQKVAAMRDYFKSAASPDAAWALFFLTGSKLKGTINWRVLRDAAIQATGLPEWMVDECHEAVGDFSETIALILPPPTSASRLGLADTVETFIRPMIGAKPELQRDLLSRAWSSLGERERLVFHKIIRGGFRLGVQRPLVLRALAEASGADAAMLEARLMGVFAPDPKAFDALVSPEPSDADRQRPVPFMLASPVPPREPTPEPTLGPLARWRAEWKYDGIRAQLVRGAGEHITLWSRGEEIINAQFPAIVAAARGLPEDTILDGEVLAWENGRPKSFAALQQHLNRKDAKSAQPGLFEQERVVFVAFDLIRVGGQDLAAQPLRERAPMLERTLASSSGRDTIFATAPVAAGSWEELASARAGARALGYEGLVLKALDSPYVSGRQRVRSGEELSGWWKWKLDPYSVDAVLIYAQPGSGKRAGLFTDYTFAVWDREGVGLTPFCKAYSGLTAEEIERVDAFVRQHTLSKSGPVRMVEPALVFEIGFEGIARSNRHKSGIAVRFPRMLRWRTDKTAKDADSIRTLEALLPRD